MHKNEFLPWPHRSCLYFSLFSAEDWRFSLWRGRIWQVLDLGILSTAGKWEWGTILKIEGQWKFDSGGETSGPLSSFVSQKTNSWHQLSNRKLIESFLRNPSSNEKTTLILSCKSFVFLKPEQLVFSGTPVSRLAGVQVVCFQHSTHHQGSS